MTWFSEGLPPDQAIPWEVWLPPLFWWITFIGALLTVSFCLVAIVRLQWIDRERIVFPLAQIRLEMIASPSDDRKLPALMRAKIFWVGFSIPFLVVSWNIVSYFLLTFPEIPLKRSGKQKILKMHSSGPLRRANSPIRY